MNRNELERAASFILGEDVLAELKEWYTETLEEDWSYVVFIVRRCYILALILEILTGRKMNANRSTNYLTDASMILHCDALAETYRRTGRIPMILLCDDVCIHGRSINHFIETMEQRLISLLPEYNEADIKEALSKALRIHVYVRAAGSLLLLGKYEFNLSFRRIEDIKFMHGFSSDVSMLILQSGIANPSYIFSERVSNQKIESLNLGDYIETSYQNTKEYTAIKFIGNGSSKKAIFSLRIIKNIDGQCYVHPFVFMPNLGGEETFKLFLIIRDRMRERGIQEEYIARLSELEQLPGKRTFNEIVTLLFSFALLQDFNREHDIAVQEEDKVTEIIRLARNYDWYGFNDAKEWIEKILFSQLFTSEEVARILDHVVLPERRMINISYGSKNFLSHTEQLKIKDRAENYLYIKGHEEEEDAYELSRNPFARTKRRVSRNVRGCGFLLSELNDGYTELQAKYSVAYFLQMMDAGVVCLSSYAPNYMNVVGMSQFAKTGEQSLMCKPLKFYEWIPMLALIENDCEGNPEEFYIELEKYCENPSCDFNSDQVEALEDFAESIYSMGHKIRDWSGWNISYLNKLEIDLPDSEHLSPHKKKSKFLDLQIMHMENYKKYKRYF